jgi:hypothetical protein
MAVSRPPIQEPMDSGSRGKGDAERGVRAPQPALDITLTTMNGRRSTCHLRTPGLTVTIGVSLYGLFAAEHDNFGAASH